MKTLIAVMDGVMTDTLRAIPLLTAATVAWSAMMLLHTMHTPTASPIGLTLSLTTLFILLFYWLVKAWPRTKNRRVGTILIITATLMFASSYALVPFYHVLCRELGINSEVTQQGKDSHQKGAYHRRQLITRSLFTAYQNLPWKATTGPLLLTNHHVVTQTIHLHNQDKKTHTARLRISFAPGQLARYLHPLEPIQDRAITLKAHQQISLHIHWKLAANTPKLQDATLHFTFFPMKDQPT